MGHSSSRRTRRHMKRKCSGMAGCQAGDADVKSRHNPAHKCSGLSEFWDIHPPVHTHYAGCPQLQPTGPPAHLQSRVPASRSSPAWSPCLSVCVCVHVFVCGFSSSLMLSISCLAETNRAAFDLPEACIHVCMRSCMYTCVTHSSLIPPPPLPPPPQVLYRFAAIDPFCKGSLYFGAHRRSNVAYFSQFSAKFGTPRWVGRRHGWAVPWLGGATAGWRHGWVAPRLGGATAGWCHGWVAPRLGGGGVGRKRLQEVTVGVSLCGL